MIKIDIPEDDLTVPIKNVSLIPKDRGGIYKFYNESRELMYIGQSKDLHGRISSHLSGTANTKDIHHNFKVVSCLFVEDPLEREIYETYMINTLKPLLNTEKVLTYRSMRYESQYNSETEEKERKWQEKYEKVMEDFSL